MLYYHFIISIILYPRNNADTDTDFIKQLKKQQHQQSS